MNEDSIKKEIIMAPRTNEQNEKIKDERREQILFNALKLFAKRGLAATKISDIAQSSGFSQGLVYHYFKSKEDVYTELVRRAVESSSQGVLALEKTPLEPLEKIKFIAKMSIESINKQDEAAYYFLLMTQASVYESNPEEAKQIIKNSFAPFEAMVRIVKEGQAKGLVRKDKPEALATVFWSAINGLALNKIALGEEFIISDSEIIVRIFE